MAYFSTRNIAAIALSSSLWAVLNWLVAPIFWQLTHLPILCDMVGTSLLVLTLWWTRKPGAPTLMGLVATVLNFILRPGALHFLGFTAASVVFDLAALIVGYRNSLDRGLVSSVILVVVSLLSTTVAGIIIGTFFMNPMLLTKMFGGVAFFAAIHGLGGIVGGALGVVITRGLEARQVIPR